MPDSIIQTSDSPGTGSPAKEVDTEKASALDKPHGYEIGAGRLNRILAVPAFAVLGKFRRLRKQDVVFCPFDICIKATERGQLVEANTMEFVRQHTSLPVPKVYCAFKFGKRTYIAMQRLPGAKICIGWHKRTSESKAKIFAQLKSMVEELRSIPAPAGGGPRNLVGGPLYDIRVPTQGDIEHEFGPFATTRAFHRHLRFGWRGNKIRNTSPLCEEKLNTLFRMHQDGTWPLRLTHADLSAFNVLVEGDDVVGIIDWETAGWYPSYYEYTQVRLALSFGDWANDIMIDNADEFLEPFPEEYEMDLQRMRLFRPV